MGSNYSYHSVVIRGAPGIVSGLWGPVYDLTGQACERFGIGRFFFEKILPAEEVLDQDFEADADQDESAENGYFATPRETELFAQ